jgi:hypothetical protein
MPSRPSTRWQTENWAHAGRRPRRHACLVWAQVRCRGTRATHPTFRSDPDLWLYRERTLGMLRRYHRLSVEVGRLPSLLGREFFRTRVTSYHVGTFEDAVIFVHDVARGLATLGSFDHKLIARIVLQDYTHNETARLLGCWRRTVGRRFPEALDRLYRHFPGSWSSSPVASDGCCARKNVSRGQNWGKFRK